MPRIALIDGVGAQDHGVADDLAGLFQPLHARPDRGARHAEIDREVRDAAPRVMPQQRDQPFVERIHGLCHFGQIDCQNDKSILLELPISPVHIAGSR